MSVTISKNLSLINKIIMYQPIHILLRNQSYEETLKGFKKNNPHINCNNNNNNNIKIVVYSHTPPCNTSDGGVMVLHNLAKTLSDLNLPKTEIYLYHYDNKQDKNQFCNNFFNPFFLDDNTIVIYPEIIKGNPLGAKHVIRWILLDIGIETQMDTVLTWNSNDLVFHWESPKSKYGKQLVCMWNNPEIIMKYPITSEKRKYSSYSFKKVLRFPNSNLNPHIKYIHKINSINIDNLSISETIEIFNQCHTFYCYDPNSFFAIMAVLCGCLTILYPITNISKQEFYHQRMIHKNNFYLDSGIAYGNDPIEINRAKNTLPYIKQDLIKLQNIYNQEFMLHINDIINHILYSKKLDNTVKNIYF